MIEQPLDATSPKPLYEQVKDFILHHIQDGTFKPHTRIPSERELAQRFGVNRLTVTKAIKELEQAGLVYVRIGKGTFVAPETYNLQLDTLMSFTEEMRQRGHEVSSRVLNAAMTEANAESAHRLCVPVGTRVAILRRVRCVNDQPIALETSTLLASACPDLFEHHDFTAESLYAALRTRYKLALAYAEQTLEARAASREEAVLLEMAERAPVLAIQRVTYDDRSRAVEYASSVYRGDRYKFRAVLKNL
ncbi:GntR family transcriptional regulator [Aggregatilineales bacterium SYSU G02658]